MFYVNLTNQSPNFNKGKKLFHYYYSQFLFFVEYFIFFYQGRSLLSNPDMTSCIMCQFFFQQYIFTESDRNVHC